MADLAGVLRHEIRRLARKELKAELTATKKAVAQYRRDIAELKRLVHSQDRKIASLNKAASKPAAAAVVDGVTNVRFSPKWLRSHRTRLEISQADYAALVGVSPLTIYNWESGKTRPGGPQMIAWAAVRGLGKREAWKRLEEME